MFFQIECTCYVNNSSKWERLWHQLGKDPCKDRSLQRSTPESDARDTFYKVDDRSMQNTLSLDLAFPSKFRSFLDGDVRRRKTDHGISTTVFSRRAGTRFHCHKAISL